MMEKKYKILLRLTVSILNGSRHVCVHSLSLKEAIWILLVFVSFIKRTEAATTESTVEVTTENPCFVNHGCLNGADCDNAGTCICKEGFSGSTCATSELVNLAIDVQTQVATADLSKAAEFAQQAQNMMDNQISATYTGMAISVLNTNTIATSILTIIENDQDLADNAVVDLSGLTEDITEMTTDILKGTRQAQSAMTTDELETAVTSAETNLINMVNLMLDKRDTGNTSSTSIDTGDVCVRVVKAKGRDVPVEFAARDAGFALPFFETFQDKKRKKNVSISVLAYKESPYLHVDNSEVVGSSVIKLHVLDKKGKEEKDIKDKDDPIDVYVNTNKLDEDGYFEDMTESLTDSGWYMSYVDTNETAGGFMMEIKLTSLKICDVYCKYDSYPDEDNYDVHVKTKGKSRIKYRDPLDLRVTFQKQLLKITLAPKKDGNMQPLVVIASCEDDRQDTADSGSGTGRRKRATGLSLVKHQFRTGVLNVRTLEEGSGNWTSNDLLKDIGADSGQIQFKSHFFGTFSADMFFIGPTPIDFSKLFANFIASFEDSPYAFAAIVCIIIIFGFLTIPLYRADKSDEIMWSFLPLMDNSNSAAVVYFLSVETSMTSPKVMKSSVYVNIIGKDASSGTRRLDDGTRKNFTRGTSSHFEMRLHKDLGDLKTVQVWHDNVDEKTAWLLQKITVIKAESSERYIFLCGKWLSLDSEDGKTWRSVDVLDENHIETDTLFHNLTQKKLFDDHLWVSLFKRPRCSRFTRVQRLWCLLALLFLAMISSAMWYDTPDDNKMQTISVGPLKLNYKQFYVGLMSGLIALVPSMLLVLIFKNRKFKGEKTAGCHVPWWFIFLAYILVFLCVGASGTFVFLYSLQWGGAKSLEWMVSFVLAIFQSVVILEPVKAILLAILVACLFKKMGSRELADKNMVVPVVEKTEYVTDLEKGEATITQQESCMYPDFPGLEKEEAELVVARTQAQLDKRMWSKFQSWLGMMMYVVLVALICSHSDVPTAYRQNEHLLQTISTVYTPNSTNEIYDWIKTTFNRAVYPKWWESEDDELLRPAYVQRFTLNAYNFRITLSRLRQIRVQGNCSGPDVTRNAVDTCIPTFSKKTTENRHFCTSWEEFNETDCFDENEEFQYSFLHNFGERKSAGDSTYNGQHGKYGPDGYYIDLGPKQSLVTKYLNLLQESSWIDYRTRALFLDVVTYNANTRLFSHIKIVFELPTTGSITLTTEVWSANLYPYVYAIDYLVLLLQFIFIIVMLVRFVLFIVNFYRWRTRALLRISTYLRLMELTFGIVAIVCCILRIDATISAIALLKKSIGRYVSFELVRLYDAAYNGCLAAVLFIITLDLLKPLEFNYHFFMLVSSLKIARTAIFAFIFIIALELIAFAALLYLTIGRQHELFRSMPESINTLVTVLLAMMTYESEEFDDILVKIYFGIYTMSVTITLVNVFFVLLTISFNDVKEGLKKGTLIYDEKLNAHFWYKVDKMVQWFIDRCCFSWVKRNRNELEKLQECLEKLKHMTNLMTKNDLERHKLTAKMMIKMIELDKYRTKLDCLNVQWNEFATKYIFGYGSTGETLVILSVPTLSSVVEIDIECYLVPCLRRDAVRKTKNKVCGNSFMFCTSDNKLLKGSVNLEVIYNKPNMTYNTIVTKKDKHSVWETQYSFETNTGIHASLQHIPFHFCTMETVKNESEKGIRPFEWYQVQQEGRTVFPSYDTESSVSFTKDTFKNSCSVSIRSMPGTTATILNVILEFPPEKPMRVHLPHLFEEGNNLKADHPGEYIISAKEGSEQEHIRHNSVLKKDKDGFDFLYDTRKHWKNLEVTVKSSKILWVDNFGVNSNYDINLIKAIVMVSKVRDIASKWKQIAAMLSIAVEEIDKSNDKTLCQEEKCFLVFRRWLEKEEVTFSMLTLLLTSIGHRVTAEHIRRKWIVNSPKEITKTKSKFFTKVELDNKKEKNSSANSTLTISSIDK